MGLLDLEEETIAQEFLRLQADVKELVYDKKNLEALQLIADYIILNHKIKTIRDDKIEEMYIYKDGIYLENGKSYIKELTKKILDKQYTKQKANNIIENIIAITYIDQEDFFNQQIENKFLIPVNNGILNLKTKELLPFDPNYYFFNKLNLSFDESFTCDNIINFIKQITRSEDDVKVIQELFGFCLIKDYTFEKAFMFHGEHGRNGKSKLLEILKYFVNINNVSSIDLEDFINDSFAVSNLRNKLVNIGSDISNEDINSTGMFKKLTGRDPIQANRKNLSRIQFVNYAKMIFAANELPLINTNSDAFWLRWVIIEFPYQFLPQKEINAIDENKREGVFLQDPNVVENLISVDSLSGLLNWAIEGLHRLLDSKDFSNKDTTKDIRISWLRKSNSVSAFILDEIDEDYDSHVTKKEFKKRYINYCRVNRIKTLSDRAIKKSIENDIGATTSRKTSFVEGVGSEFTYIWEGIGFKTKHLELKEVKNTDQSLLVSEEFVVDGRDSVKKSMGDVAEFRSGRLDDV